MSDSHLLIVEQTSPATASTHPHVLVRQGASVLSGNGVLTHNVVLPSPALAGSLIVVGFAGDKDSGTMTFSDNTASGTWNIVSSLRSTSVTLYTAWKVAVGGESTITETHTIAAASGNSMGILELTDDRGGTPQLLGFDDTITNESSVTSVVAGTTSPIQEGMAIAFAAVDSGTSVVSPATVSWSNGYAERINSQTGGGRGSIFMATAYVSGGASTTTTMTSGGGATADQWSGALMVIGAPAGTTVGPDGIASGEAFGTPILGVGVHSVIQGAFRWYTDAADGSMVPLAAQNTMPTLSAADMQNGILRLRVSIDETGGAAGSGSVILQYREAATAAAWTNVQTQTPTSNSEGIWFRYANGAGTSGSTISTTKLTTTTASGKYIEDASQTISVGALAKVEVDFALKVHWPPPDTWIDFRIVYAGALLGLNTTACTLTTSIASDRPNTITRLDGDLSQKTSREVRFASWRRVFWDPVGANWWLFTVQYNTPTVIRSYRWDGSGNWTAGATYTSAQSSYQTRHAFVAKVTGTGLTVYCHVGTSGSTRLFNRGTIAGTTLTWGTEQSLSQATDRHTHIAIDDGGFVYATGVTAGVGVWSRRASSADSVSAWSAAVSAADTSLVSGDVMASIGLASGKVMQLWRSSTGTAIKYVVVTGGVAGTVGNATTTSLVNAEDWGIVRSNGYVYLIHTDANGAGGNWVLRAFNESTETWATCTSPGVSGQITSNDGLPMSADATGLVVYGTMNAVESGQDRKVSYKRYTGVGAGGTWGSLIDLDAGGRVNSDHISASEGPGAGNMFLVVSAANDDDVVGNARTLEFFPTPANYVVSPTAKASDEAFGTLTITTGGALQTLSPTALGTGESFGSLTVSTTITASSTGIATSEVFGSLTVTRVVTSSPTGVASAETFGTLSITVGVSTLSPTGIASAQAFGLVIAGGGTILSPVGIGSGLAFGNDTASRNPLLPLRAAFYYPWFTGGSDPSYPGAWNQGIIKPWTQYHPKLGYYDSSSTATIDAHIAAMQYGKFKVGISSWWGVGSREDGVTPTLLSRAAALGTDFKWCLYYEAEGNAIGGVSGSPNPTVAQITSDLNYLTANYTQHPNYLRVNGKPVIFVYGDPTDDDTVTTVQANRSAARWSAAVAAASEPWYYVLKVYSGYTTDHATYPASSWHQYGPAARVDVQGSYSRTISPGFWLTTETTPRLTRDPALWAQNVRDLVTNGESWKLVTSFNEFGEGHPVENVDAASGRDYVGSGWDSSSGFGTYLDYLALDGPILPSGIASAEAFGVPTITQSAAVSPSGIGSSQAFGTLTLGGQVSVSPSGIATAEALGTPAVVGSNSVAPTGIASAEAFGALTVSRFITSSPTGIASAEAFGALAVSTGGAIVSPTAVASAEAFGTLTITVGSVSVSPTGVASAEGFGTLSISAAISLAPTGVGSGEAFGSLTVSRVITVSPTGVATVETFGTLTISTGGTNVSPTGIVTAEVFGSLVVTSGGAVLGLTGIVSGETFGTTVVSGIVAVSPTGIVTAGALGVPGVSSAIATSPVGVASLEAVPGPVVTRTVTTSPAGLASAETFGTLTLSTISAIALSGIATAEAFGALSVSQPVAKTLSPVGIASGETIGTLFLTYPGLQTFTGWGIPL